MRKLAVGYVLVMLGMQSACNLAIPLTPPAAPVPALAQSTPVPPPTAPTKSGKIRASLGGLDVTDLPYLMALDSLRAQGYTVETIQFDRFELISAAMAKGDLEIAGASRQTTWAAIGRGAPIREVLSKSRNYYYLVTRQEIKGCADLGGKTIAVGGTTGVVYAMVTQYLKLKCPGSNAQLVVIANSGNRTAALLAGQIDGSPIELENLLRLQRDAPNRFHALVDFDKEFPEVEIVGYYVQLAWAAKNPEIVKDYLRAHLTAIRMLVDKQALRQAVVKYFGPDDTAAQTTAEAYVERKLWDVNGGLTLEKVRTMIEFLTSAGALNPGVKPEDVANVSYLNAVLTELGTK